MSERRHEQKGPTIGELLREQFRQLERNMSDVTKRQLKTYPVLESLVKRGEQK